MYSRWRNVNSNSPRGRRLPPASRLVDENRLAGPIVAHLPAAPAAAEAADTTADRGARRNQGDRHPDARDRALRPVPLAGCDAVGGGERAEIVDEAHVGAELYSRRPKARAHLVRATAAVRSSEGSENLTPAPASALSPALTRALSLNLTPTLTLGP